MSTKVHDMWRKARFLNRPPQTVEEEEKLAEAEAAEAAEVAAAMEDEDEVVAAHPKPSKAPRIPFQEQTAADRAAAGFWANDQVRN